MTDQLNEALNEVLHFSRFERRYRNRRRVLGLGREAQDLMGSFNRRFSNAVHGKKHRDRVVDMGIMSSPELDVPQAKKRQDSKPKG